MSSDSDPLDDAISDLVRAAQQDLEGASRMESAESKDRGELVERSQSVSFVLMAPGYCLRDFKVSVGRDKLHVEAPDFEITRVLRCKVDPAIKTEYRNGVLSIRIPKKL
jgi:HSP20 family molecular chaperone IbpA